MAVGVPTVLVDQNRTLTSGDATTSAFTPTAGANQCVMILIASFGNAITSAVMSTDGAMTQIGTTITTPYLGYTVSAFRRMAPTAVSQTINLDTTAGAESHVIHVKVIECAGVDATTPHDAIESASLDSPASVTNDVASATDERVIGFGIFGTDPTPEQTIVGTDTQLGATGYYMAAQQVAGSSSVSVDWTGTSFDQVAAIWFSLNASGGGASGQLLKQMMQHYY